MRKACLQIPAGPAEETLEEFNAVEEMRKKTKNLGGPRPGSRRGGPLQRKEAQERSIRENQKVPQMLAGKSPHIKSNRKKNNNMRCCFFFRSESTTKNHNICNRIEQAVRIPECGKAAKLGRKTELPLSSLAIALRFCKRKHHVGKMEDCGAGKRDQDARD